MQKTIGLAAASQRKTAAHGDDAMLKVVIRLLQNSRPEPH
jgi:hypothetical protein